MRLVITHPLTVLHTRMRADLALTYRGYNSYIYQIVEIVCFLVFYIFLLFLN